MTRNVRAAAADRLGRHRQSLLRRLAGRWILWLLTSGVVIVWWCVTAYTSGTVTSAVEDGDTRVGVISRVVTDDDGYTENFAIVDGREFLLSDAPTVWTWGEMARLFSDATTYQPGQQVELALDPDPDPVYNWAYDVSKYEEFSWTAAAVGLAFMVGLVSTVRRFLTRNLLVTDGMRWQLWRTRRTTTVTVREVRASRCAPWAIEAVGRMFGDRKHQQHHVVIEAGDRVYFWEAKSEGHAVLESGTTFEVFGRVHRRGWIVAASEPPIYSAARLD